MLEKSRPNCSCGRPFANGIFVFLISNSLLFGGSEILNEKEQKIPNIAACAKRNFPEEAKPIVSKAMVIVKIKVDKTGLVREAKAVHVKLVSVSDAEKAEATKPMFRAAGEKSLLNQKCPIFYQDDKPTPYMLEVPLQYELY